MNNCFLMLLLHNIYYIIIHHSPPPLSLFFFFLLIITTAVLYCCLCCRPYVWDGVPTGDILYATTDWQLSREPFNWFGRFSDKLLSRYFCLHITGCWFGSFLSSRKEQNSTPTFKPKPCPLARTLLSCKYIWRRRCRSAIHNLPRQQKPVDLLTLFL